MLVPKLRFKREDGTSYPEWEIIRLGELCTLTNGISKGKDYFGHGNRMVNLQDVFSSNWLTDNSEFDLVEVTPKELEEKRIIKGDVLFIRSSVKPSGVGLPCVIATEMKDTVFSGFIIRARFFQERLDIGYKRYCFLEEDFRNAIMKKCSVSANTNINQENLENIGVKTPCLEEQQKIADFLSTVDEVIAQSEAEVQNLEQQKKAAMQKIFSQEVRFKREDGTEFPKWEKKRMGDETYIKSRIGWQALKKDEYLLSGDYYLITGTDINDNMGIDYRYCRYVSKERYEMDSNIQVYNGDLIVTKDGTIGKVAIIQNLNKPATLNSHLFLIRDLSGNVDTVYLSQILSSKIFKDYIELTKTGSTLTGLPQKTFVDFVYPLPCLEEQQKIADFLSAYDEAINYAKQELEHWKQLKKGLLQQMFV